VGSGGCGSGNRNRGAGIVGSTEACVTIRCAAVVGGRDRHGDTGSRIRRADGEDVRGHRGRVVAGPATSAAAASQS